jgi:hypothetical protein
LVTTRLEELLRASITDWEMMNREQEEVSGSPSVDERPEYFSMGLGNPQLCNMSNTLLGLDRRTETVERGCAHESQEVCEQVIGISHIKNAMITVLPRLAKISPGASTPGISTPPVQMYRLDIRGCPNPSPGSLLIILFSLVSSSPCLSLATTNKPSARKKHVTLLLPSFTWSSNIAQLQIIPLSPRLRDNPYSSTAFLSPSFFSNRFVFLHTYHTLVLIRRHVLEQPIITNPAQVFMMVKMKNHLNQCTSKQHEIIIIN